MIELIAQLERRGFAYQSGGNVYFDVSKLADYGKLARLNLEQLKAGARIEVDAQKRHPLDFALWFTKSKFSEQEMKWDSPWGIGYPGWHIECSAMAQAYLGETLDIHCGGVDHISVHHTNEIAQSEGASGKPFARIWMHAGFLVMGKDKMAKSSGEFLTLDRLTEKGFDPISYRLFCLTGSYRNELSWNWQALEAAGNTLKRLKNLVSSWRSEKSSAQTALSSRALDLQSSFEHQMYNDLNFPNALAVLHQASSESEISAGEKLTLLLNFDRILGLGIDAWGEQSEDIPEQVLQLVSLRQIARQNKEWKTADALRAEILSLGYVIEDRGSGEPRIIKS